MNKKQLQKETIKYIKETNREYRKSKGQYFTPKILREALLKRLPFISNPKILDPASGTGEFLLSARKFFKKPKLYGWEIDEKLVKISKNLIPEAVIEETDTLKKETDKKFDFVIGNPPYYEFKLDKDLKKKYAKVTSGRVNIYSLFIYKAVNLLKEGGYLAFVVPPSMNNGAYFAKLRKFIVNNCNIEYLTIRDTPHLFEDALQSVMLLILKKGKNDGSYLFQKNGIMIFSENANSLKNAFEKKQTLAELGYEVRTGELVWNQNKHLLINESTSAVPLIWSHNITEEGLKFNNKSKPQFVKGVSPNKGPAIVVNRIVGRPGNGRIKAALIPEEMLFVAENHVNVIFKLEQKKLWEKDKESLEWETLLAQLNSQKNANIIQNITGNTQISRTELKNLFPVRLM